MVDKGLVRLKRRHVIMTVVILLIVLLVSVPVFLYFKVTTESRLALREAKNVKLTFNMLDIDYYAQNKCIYSANKPNGLSDGVQEEIEKNLEHECTVAITSYDSKLRKVLGFVYTSDHCQVVYRYDNQNGDTWKVSYLLNILEYDGE